VKSICDACAVVGCPRKNKLEDILSEDGQKELQVMVDACSDHKKERK